MKLEDKVKGEIELWDINIEDRPDLLPALKEIYYAIGITLTKLAMDNLNWSVDKDARIDTKLNYHDAVDKFKFEYFVENLSLYNFDLKETNFKCNIADNEKNAWATMTSILKKYAVTFKTVRQVKLSPNYEVNLHNEENIEKMLTKKIEEYGVIAGKSLLRRGLEKGKIKMSKRFIQIAKYMLAQEDIGTHKYELFGMHYRKAVLEFQKRYLIKQYFDSEKDGKLAAKNAGLYYKEYNRLVNKIGGTSFKELNNAL